MPGKHLFEYAVIRVVPQVEREEFLNVGVVLLCAGQKFLEAKIMLDEGRLGVFCKDLDIDMLRTYAASFTKICQGGVAAGSIGQMPLAERFRWLTATRSTILQPSRVHPGLCDDARATLERLFAALVDFPG